MKGLKRKLFAAFATFAALVILLATSLSAQDAFTAREIIVLFATSLLGALAFSFIASRVISPAFEQIAEFANSLAKGRRDARLHWTYGDDRDSAAGALNRLADQLLGEIDHARSEAQQLAAVMTGMAGGVLVLDLNDRVIHVNPGFRELFQSWGPTQDRPLLEVVRSPDVEDILKEAKRQNAPVVRDIEVRSGGDRTVLAHAVRFPAEGPPAGTLVVFHDVTEIRRVDRVRRDFVANASHELRTPLTAVQGFAETLDRGGLAAADQERALGAILRNVKRMEDLIDDLMALSRIEHSEYTLVRGPVDAKRIARERVDDLKPRIEREEMTIEILGDEGLVCACDQSALTHILDNLLTNALRYSDRGGRIDVSIEAAGDMIEIAISDTGIGIPEESLDRIFERFFRVDATRARAVGSTGLGLSIVRHLVQAMGGTIRVESQVGVGSRFSFTVPRDSSSTAGA